MSYAQEALPLEPYLSLDYWGEKREVKGGPGDSGGATDFEKKIAKNILKHVANLNEEVVREVCASGYNLFFQNFDIGTILFFEIERMTLVKGKGAGKYLKDSGMGVVLPTVYGRRGLYALDARKKKLEHIVAKSEPLILGLTTVSHNFDGRMETLERLLSLEIIDEEATMWQKEREKYISGSFTGRLRKWWDT
jgi:hypothetical protein